MLTLSTLAITYLAVGACLFLFYLVAFLRDRETPKTHLMSWIVLFVASIFWIVILPVSIYRKLTGRGSVRFWAIAK